MAAKRWYATAIYRNEQCRPASAMWLAEHWVHIRTTNPIESTFATVRLRTKRTRNCGSRDTTLAMVYKLLQTAESRRKRIKGFKPPTLVVNNIKFEHGEQIIDQSDRKAA